MTTSTTKTKKTTPNEAKFRELLLHVARKCDEHDKAGVVKRNKILFLCEVFAYRALGTPLTGTVFEHHPNGPVPRGADNIIKDLEKKHEAYGLLDQDPWSAHKRRRLIGRRAVLKDFAPEEVALIDDVIDWAKNKTGNELRDFTHAMPGWRLTANREEIPAFTALLPDDGPLPLSLAEHEIGRKVAALYV